MQAISETNESNVNVVTIKFRPSGKQYHFNAQGLSLRPGDRVIVETDRGRAMGTVVLPPKELRPGEGEDLKSILRLATEDDLAMASQNTAREEEAFRFCKRRIEERKMEMKLVKAEYLFDGSKIIFYFTADGRVDFRELVKDLAHYYHTRIEMRQIGVRDEAKMTGGIGICGRELCCCTFLTEFAPVSVKMAKEQGLALNPNKISGQCGRLLCCLAYEFETYCEMKKALPKCGRKVQLEGQSAEVLDKNVLSQTVTVKLEDGKKVELTADQVEKGEIPPAEPSPFSPQEKEEPPQEKKPRRNRPRRKGPRKPQGQGQPQEGGQGSGKEKEKKAEAPRPKTSEKQTKDAQQGDGAPRRDKAKRGRNRRRPRQK